MFANSTSASFYFEFYSSRQKNEIKINMDAKIIEEVQTRYILHWNYRGLTCLPPEVIQFGAHVEEIYLKENGLQTLPENVHQILPKLREIYLYGNSLQK